MEIRYIWFYTSGPDEFYIPTPKFIYIIIHSGWSLAWIFMKERVKVSVLLPKKKGKMKYLIYQESIFEVLIKILNEYTTFLQIKFGIFITLQKVWTQIRLDKMSALRWIHTVWHWCPYGVYWTIIFEEGSLKKTPAIKKHAKLPSMQRVEIDLYF